MVRRIANIGLLYPVCVVAALYGEWFLAWSILGHPPEPSLDDPRDIAGSSWLHPVTGLALTAYLPLGVAAVVMNVAQVTRERAGRKSVVVRGLLFVGSWFGTAALFRADPGRVMEWWFD